MEYCSLQYHAVSSGLSAILLLSPTQEHSPPRPVQKLPADLIAELVHGPFECHLCLACSNFDLASAGCRLHLLGYSSGAYLWVFEVFLYFRLLTLRMRAHQAGAEMKEY